MAENSYENIGQANKQPKFEIPKQPEEGLEKQTEKAIEQRQISEGKPVKQTPQFPAQDPAAIAYPAASPPATNDDNAHASGSTFSAGLPAQNTDLIEKQWVERAKAIVAKTQDDPYKQKDEMSKMKADYIKKRFDKTIPIDDTAKA